MWVNMTKCNVIDKFNEKVTFQVGTPDCSESLAPGRRAWVYVPLYGLSRHTMHYIVLAFHWL